MKFRVKRASEEAPNIPGATNLTESECGGYRSKYAYVELTTLEELTELIKTVGPCVLTIDKSLSVAWIIIYDDYIE